MLKRERNIIKENTKTLSFLVIEKGEKDGSI